MPQLGHAGRDQVGDRAGILEATLHLDQRPHDLVAERAAGEFLGLGRSSQTRLDPDPGVHGRADDPRPAELAQVDRDEVGRLAPGADRGRPGERVGIDCLGRRQANRKSWYGPSDRGDRRIAGSRAQGLESPVVPRMNMDREGAGAPDRDRVGRELGRRQRNRWVLGPRAAAVQARLHRHIDLRLIIGPSCEKVTASQPVARAEEDRDGPVVLV